MQGGSLSRTADILTVLARVDGTSRGLAAAHRYLMGIEVFIRMHANSCLVLVARKTGGETAGDQQEGPTAEIGEPLRVGDVTWVVEDAKTATELTSSYEKPVRGNFVVVNFTFTNEGKEAATLDTASMALIDSEGRRNEADPDKFGYIPDGRNIFLENVNPGVTDRGRRSSPWRRGRRASSWSWATPTCSPTQRGPCRSTSEAGVWDHRSGPAKGER